MTNLRAYHGCMRQGVEITTSKKRDAECICAALTQYGGSVEQDGKRWSVHLSASASTELPNLLTALKACLDEDAIAAVEVAVDGTAYALGGGAWDGSSPPGQD